MRTLEKRVIKLETKHNPQPYSDAWLEVLSDQELNELIQDMIEEIGEDNLTDEVKALVADVKLGELVAT